MLYRPNFCSHCGEKIERENWPIMASRRFCDVCQTENQAVDWVPRIVLILGLVFGAAGLIAIFRPTQPIENIRLRSSSELVTRSGETLTAGQINATPTTIPQSQAGTVTTETPRPPTAATPPQKGSDRTSQSDAVYYCGAATKKGTACTRRVKHPGERCWQHQGMPAMAENGQKIMR